MARNTTTDTSDIQLRLRKIKNGFLVLDGEQVYFDNLPDAKADIDKRIDKWAKNARPIKDLNEPFKKGA